MINASTDELNKKIEQWFHIPCIAGQIFTLVGVHYLSLPMLLFCAIIIDFTFSILKYFIVSSFEIIYSTIGNSVVLWIWSIGTFIYFIFQGQWWIGIYPLIYFVFLSSIVGIPGIYVVDKKAFKILNCNPKNWVAEQFRKQI